MNFTHILIRYGEIFLKGKNRINFENKLITNIKKITGIKNVQRSQGRLVIDYFAEHQKLKHVFGVVSYSLALKSEKSLDEIKKSTLTLLKDKKGTFKVETKRSDKSFTTKSPEFNVILGKFIEENNPNLLFSFKNPQFTLFVEINQEGVFLFLDKIVCFAGLPSGVEGRVLLLLENNADILAGLSFMRRGTALIPLSLKKGKAKILSLLQKFSPTKLRLHTLKDFAEIEQFAVKNELDLLVCGQNFENFAKLPTKLTIFRPLIAYSEKEIAERLAEFSV